MSNRYIIDRKLPERAHLTFFFPNTSEGANYIMVKLPFFENPSIKESKKARYQKYSLISRSSNLYTYLGADSRRFSLDFNISLPHILEEYPQVTIDEYINRPKLDSNISKIEAFKGPSVISDKATLFSKKYSDDVFQEGMKNSVMSVLFSDWGKYGITDEESNYLKTLYGVSEESAQKAQEQYNKAINLAANVAQSFTFGNIKTGQAITKLESDISTTTEKEKMILTDAQKKKFTLIDVIIYWTNIIRASVVNNARNPLYGPPVIRLSHGLMYQNVPCICTNYSIDWEERAGYDLTTLLPRRLNIRLNLEEFRTGDFGDFDFNFEVQKDNLAGWEAVISQDSISMDPGYEGLGITFTASQPVV